MNTKTQSNTASRTDVHTRITETIVADLEQGVRPWMKPWGAEQAVGRITRPLRHTGQAYSGINVLMLWSAGLPGHHSSSGCSPLRVSAKYGRLV